MKRISFCLLLSLLIFTACKKELTSWASDWSLPLVSDTLDLKNLVTDSFIGTNGSGYYQLEINRDILDLNLTDYIDIPDTTVVQKYAIGISSLNVTPGTSFVNNNKDHEFSIQDAQLKKARLSAGKVKITVSSPIQTGTIFTVKLPGVKKDGVSIQKVVQVPAGTLANPQVVSSEIDLSGYEIDLRGTGGEGYNLLQSEMKVQTSPSGSATNVSNQDSTKFIIELAGLKFDYARGYFGRLTVEDTSSIFIDALNKITEGNLDLAATNLQFIIQNGIKVGARANLVELKNIHPSHGTIALTHPQIGVPFMLDAAAGSWGMVNPFYKVLDFTSMNSNIEPFIENLGSRIFLKYKLELNPYGNVSGGWDEFFPDSRLKIKLKADMPLSASLNNLTFVDTFPLNLAQNTDKAHISEGKLKLKVSNAFPLQGEVFLSLLDGQGNQLAVIEANEVLKSSQQGTLENGLMKATSTLLFDIPSSLVNQLNEVKNVQVKVKMNTPNVANTANTMVLIPEGAFLKIQLNASFKFQNQY
jgi:hypothetical protein